MSLLFGLVVYQLNIGLFDEEEQMAIGSDTGSLEGFLISHVNEL